MALNNKPCKSCVFYDVIKVGSSKGARHGWCSVKSIYPAVEQAGQIFPTGVKRASVDALAKPYIITGDEVIPHCAEYQARK